VQRADFRFSRRSLREAVQWGDTQLRLRLERLVDLEYLLAHREGPGGKYVYELAYQVADEARAQVAGLMDVASLAALTTPTAAKSRGTTAEVAAMSRAGSGPIAGQSRGGESPGEPDAVGLAGDSAEVDAKPRLLKGNGQARSYPQTVAASSLAAA
jgi:hypothetical protein